MLMLKFFIFDPAFPTSSRSSFGGYDKGDELSTTSSDLFNDHVTVKRVIWLGENLTMNFFTSTKAILMLSILTSLPCKVS